MDVLPTLRTDNPNALLNQPQLDALLSQCIHCGLCLPACPTYSVYHTEMDGPRGRISLVSAAQSGRIGLDGAFQEHIERCLGCRACETACPSGVQYGQIFETARAAIETDRQQRMTIGIGERLLRWLSLREGLAKPHRLRLMARLLWLLQASGVIDFVRKRTFLPRQMRTMLNLLPQLRPYFCDYTKPAPAIGTKRGTVAFLHGCVQDAFLNDVNRDTVSVLRRNGFDVHFPAMQTCCGAAGLHIGEQQTAYEMARQNVDAFDEAGVAFDAIINNAGGCGATLKQYGHLLADDPAYAQRAQQFAAKVQDVNEFLAANLHEPPTGKINRTVTYIDSCHLRHGQKVVDQPRQLLQSIPGITLSEVRQPDMCCGSAGVYNILQMETAGEILDAKMADVKATAAQAIVTSNTGCHMQMLHGARKHGLNVNVLHVVQLLEESYRRHPEERNWFD